MRKVVIVYEGVGTIHRVWNKRNLLVIGEGIVDGLSLLLFLNEGKIGCKPNGLLKVDVHGCQDCSRMEESSLLSKSVRHNIVNVKDKRLWDVDILWHVIVDIVSVDKVILL